MNGKLVVRDADCVWPDRFAYLRPDQLAPAAEVHTVRCDGLRLDAWLAPPDTGWRGVVVHAHGNAQNLSAHLPLVLFLVRSGWAVLAFDYRGFGRSQGEPSLAGALRDTVAVVRYARDRWPGRRLVLFGQSMGAVMAGLAAREVPPDALVLESGFASYPHLYRQRYPDAVLELSLTDRVDHAIADLPCPVGIVHGTADDAVPFSYQEHFADVLTGRPHWRLDLPGDGHLTAHAGPNAQLYRDTLLGWLAGMPTR